ncbi:MAG: HNH endonuclease [Deltaproteobacteria bacterium]|nr:HNH endonuclease [Deltaproteobacteria bacterium]
MHHYSTQDLDRRVRLTAFHWLSEQVNIHGDVLPRSLLARGFVFENQRIPLVSPKGIFKPRILPEYPLSITTTTSGPYDDGFTPEGLLLYKYRGSDPYHRDNVELRNAMLHNIPIIYFHSVVPGKYLAVWPVYIVEDNPNSLTFTVAVDDYKTVNQYIHSQDDTPAIFGEVSDIRRMYITTSIKQRLHQRGFRERVINAYREQCAFCRLKHLELLDAAHIIPDGEPGGDPIVNNGVALCKLHHAAFDSFILGIRPDYKIEVREDILKEEDGPMLVHGLQSMHMKEIILPKSSRLWPNPELLERRYEKFRMAG